VRDSEILPIVPCGGSVVLKSGLLGPRRWFVSIGKDHLGADPLWYNRSQVHPPPERVRQTFVAEWQSTLHVVKTSMDTGQDGARAGGYRVRPFSVGGTHFRFDQ
jgi:hypothetical protein